MNRYLLIVVFTLACAVRSALAESEVEKELGKLRDNRHKALASVSEPIERVYTLALEELLRRAMQANDLEGAVKIRAELKGRGVNSAASLAGEAPAVVKAGKISAETLTKTPWAFAVPSIKFNDVWTFNPDKTWQGKTGAKGTWNLDADGLRVENGKFWSSFSLDGEMTKEGLSLKEVNCQSGPRGGVLSAVAELGGVR
jgi:hypothetical protein